MVRRAMSGEQAAQQRSCDGCARSSLPLRQGRSPFADRAYCEACWTSWHEACWTSRHEACRAPEVALAGSDGQVPVRPAGNHFDFIEVGTSDWGTMLQFFAGEAGFRVASLLGSEVRTSLNDIRQVRGLAVEAVEELLDALPDLPRVTKVAAAMDENGGGTTTLHLVPGKDIDANLCKHWAVYPGSDGNGVDVFWYAKSLASIGQPHPHLKAMLRDVNRLDLLASRQVPSAAQFRTAGISHAALNGATAVVDKGASGITSQGSRYRAYRAGYGAPWHR